MHASGMFVRSGGMTGQRSCLAGCVRPDLAGRFNELDVLRRQWPLYAATVQGQVLPPYEVIVHPSSSCSLRCGWCIGDRVPLEIRDGSRRPAAVTQTAADGSEGLSETLADPAAMIKLVQDIAAYRRTAWYRSACGVREHDFRVHNVSFSGVIGEPLTSKAALLPAIEYLLAHQVRVGLFTNAVLMDAQAIDVLVRTAYVNVSLDAATGSTYATLKLGGNPAGAAVFERVVSNLHALAVRRRQEHTQVEIGVSFVLHPGNYREVYDAAALAREAGADRLRLKRDISGQALLNPDQAAEAAGLVKRIRADIVDDAFALVEIHRLDDLNDQTRRFTACTITGLMAAVGSDGHLYPCNYHPRPGGYSYGSAIETSFAQVWEGPARARLRQRLPEICPPVCDPFKNRTNLLLQAGGDLAAEQGLGQLEREVTALIAAGAYDPAHAPGRPR
jgi:MoaA/NifB/PqqE/SkfB family radical SAM enzyme